MEIVAKDSFTPPAVSNRTLLNIHVKKTPTISVGKIVAGVTSLQATFDVSEFSYLKIVKYELLVQGYYPEDPNCTFLINYRIACIASTLDCFRASRARAAERAVGGKLPQGLNVQGAS